MSHLVTLVYQICYESGSTCQIGEVAKLLGDHTITMRTNYVNTLCLRGYSVVMSDSLQIGSIRFRASSLQWAKLIVGSQQ